MWLAVVVAAAAAAAACNSHDARKISNQPYFLFVIVVRVSAFLRWCDNVHMGSSSGYNQSAATITIERQCTCMLFACLLACLLVVMLQISSSNLYWTTTFNMYVRVCMYINSMHGEDLSESGEMVAVQIVEVS